MQVMKEPVTQLMHLEAFSAWEDIVGADYITIDSNDLKSANCATFLTHKKARAILYPRNQFEISECIKIARKHSLQIHPVSTGKNWGYGSKVPSVDGAVLMDLSRMTQILDYDPILGTITLEPGVTQQQLYDFLKQENSRFWMDATGSSPDTSIVGNVLQRGYGHTPYGNRWEHLISLEAVKWDGTVVKTGMAAIEGAAAAKVHRYGVGPCLDGLFSQSNYGVVTQITIELMPAPEHFEAFFFSFPAENLSDVIDALRPLRMNGVVANAVHIGNAFKVLSGIRQYPWEMTNGEGLPAWVINSFKKDWGFNDWNGAGGLYGTKKQIREYKRIIRKALAAKVSKIRFISARKLAIAKRMGGILGAVMGMNINQLIKLVEPVFGLMQGQPTATQLRSAYWRKRSSIPLKPDLDADDVGLIWCSPAASLLGCHAVVLDKIATEVLDQFELEPIIAFTLLSGRLLSGTIGITYDRRSDGADRLAMDCYQKLSTQLLDSGYPAYRLGQLAQP